MLYKPHEYQKTAIQHILDNPNAGLILDMGLGKTSIVLTATEEMLANIEIIRPLIIAPKRICEHTWNAEAAKWDELKHLKISRIIGTEKQRIAAINAPADIYIVSRDNISWLTDYAQRVLRRWPYDMIIIDESSSFKNRQSMRFKAVRRVLPKIKRMVILTGTPTPNGLLDIYPQIYLLDKGERLGKTFTIYRDQFFTAGAQNGHVVFKYNIKPGADKIIHEKISDICLSMTAKDYLTLPERLDVIEEIELDNYEKYQEFKRTEVLNLMSGEEITPVNAAAMYSILLQYCNGAVYRPDKTYEVVDSAKLDALVEAVEALNGSPVIIFYQFISDKERLLKKLPQARLLEGSQGIDDWNAGKIEVLILHAASAGHGINMQDAGVGIFWMGLPWSLELYQQANARVHRQGRRTPVLIKHFIAKNTIEELVLKRLADKNITQEALIEALKRYLT